MDAIDSEYAMKVDYGDFGEADDEIQKRSGEKNYNIKLTISFMGDRGLKEQEERQKAGATEDEVRVKVISAFKTQKPSIKYQLYEQ